MDDVTRRLLKEREDEKIRQQQEEQQAAIEREQISSQIQVLAPQAAEILARMADDRAVLRRTGRPMRRGLRRQVVSVEMAAWVIHSYKYDNMDGADGLGKVYLTADGKVEREWLGPYCKPVEDPNPKVLEALKTVVELGRWPE